MKKAVQKFESPLPHDVTPCNTGRYYFSEAISANLVPQKYFTYRPPKLVKGKRWYIEYWHVIPFELRHLYKEKRWKRFRVFEGLDTFRDEEHAHKLLKAIERSLERGFNPFEDELVEQQMEEGTYTGKLSIKGALELYVAEKKKEGLAPETVERYGDVCDRLQKWFADRKLHHQPIERVSQTHIEKLLMDLKTQEGWGNRQYNNYKGYISGVFSFLVGKRILKDNPCEKIKKLQTKAKKHTYYDRTLFPKVTRIIRENEPYLWYMVQFVYYLAVRSSKEISLVKVGDILDEGEMFHFRAGVSKNKRDEYVPIDPHLREVFQEMGVFDAPKDYYIFSVLRKPGPRPVSDDFIQKKFRKIRKLAGLTQDHTLYGFKHTRCIHLLKEGVKLADISRLFRHTDIGTTALYARDLGVDFDASDLHSRSRKI